MSICLTNAHFNIIKLTSHHVKYSIRVHPNVNRIDFSLGNPRVCIPASYIINKAITDWKPSPCHAVHITRIPSRFQVVWKFFDITKIHIIIKWVRFVRSETFSLTNNRFVNWTVMKNAYDPIWIKAFDSSNVFKNKIVIEPISSIQWITYNF